MYNPNVLCKGCNGTGRVRENHPEGGWYTIQCTKCKGRGYLKEKKNESNKHTRRKES